MSQITTNEEVTTESIVNKKPYHTPKLSELGKVSELTATNPNPSSGVDGGSVEPNVYAS